MMSTQMDASPRAFFDERFLEETAELVVAPKDVTKAELIEHYLAKRAQKLAESDAGLIASREDGMDTRALSPQRPDDVPYLLSPMEEKPIQWTLKRAMDIGVTLMGGMVILPFLLLIALAIKVESPNGPVFFKQKRIGLRGKEFYMYKFRSMHPDAEERLKELLKYNETNQGMFKLKDDPRVTRVGKFIRKYSLDEFPQLINVLKGEMSLIGFRPPLPRELPEYSPWHFVRFCTLPGLSGEWQVSGRSNITQFDDVIALDFRYIQQWSILRDIKILFKTVPVVLFGKDSY
jgi:lipopolysaccharide/colanic/teichoic acid biosynthesis glycosyltransferase